MIYFSKFCCVCLEAGQKLEKLSTTQENNISYYNKLSILIPDMNINNIKKISFICNDCKKCTDQMYNFRTTCLKNNNRLQKYISQLCLNNDDIENITTRLIIVKQKMEIPSSNLNECKSIDLNENEQMILQSKDDLVTDDLITECKREIDVNEYIEKEISDDDIEQFPSESLFDNYNSNTTSETSNDNSITSISKTNVNMLRSVSNNITKIDIIKQETFNGFVGRNDIQFENMFVNDVISDVNMNEKINLKDSSENFMDTRSETYEKRNVDFTFKTNENVMDLNGTVNNVLNAEVNHRKVINNDITLLHTEIDIDRVKKEPLDSDIHSKYSAELDNISENNEIKLNNNIDYELKNHELNTNENIDSNPRLHFDQNLPINNFNEEKFKCKICNITFPQLVSVKRHNIIFHTGVKPHKCETCNKSFIFPCDLKRHILIHSGKRTHNCDICNKTFGQLGSLKKHYKIHTREKPYKCEICNQGFIGPSHLTKHTKIHNNETYKCEKCNKVFIKKKYLVKHNRVHTGIKPYKCEKCNRSFVEKRYLLMHNNIHNEVKSFKCEKCDKSFSLKRYLLIHDRIHTGEKPYKCEVCDRAFSQSASLKNHSILHAPIKPYTCEICNKTFAQSIALKRHLITHKNVDEDHCNILN